MPTFSGADGLTGSIEAKEFKSFSGAIRLVRQGYAAIAAGDDGSISVWRGEDGQLRAEFDRHLRTLNFKKFKKQKDLKRWLERWWRQMR